MQILCAQDAVPTQFVEGEFEVVLEEAKTQNKLIFVHIIADWAEPSQGMREWIFPDENVGAYFNAHFVNYEIEQDNIRSYPFFDDFTVQSLPEYWFFSSAGEFLFRSSGFQDVDEIVQTGKNAQNPAFQFPAMVARYEAGDREPEFVRGYIETAAGIGLDVNEIAADFLGKVDENDLLKSENLQIIMLAISDPEAPQVEFVIRNQEKIEAEYGLGIVAKFLTELHNRNLEKAIENKDAGYLTKMWPLLTGLGGSEVEISSRIVSEELRYYASTSEWPQYFEKFEELFTLETPEGWQLLNDAAWNAWKHSRNTTTWKNALKWVNASIASEKNFFNIDTKAHLLYGLEKYAEAKQAALEAIELAKIAGESPVDSLFLLSQIEAKESD